MSMMLTGDLQGINYIKKTINELPENTYNFCCTVDGTCSKDQNLSHINYDLRPIQNTNRPSIDNEEMER